MLDNIRVDESVGKQFLILQIEVMSIETVNFESSFAGKKLFAEERCKNKVTNLI